MKKIRDTLFIVTIFTLLFCSVVYGVENKEIGQPNNEISIVIDGAAQNYQVSPILENGTVLVPMRAIFEELGADVVWNEYAKSILARKAQTEVQIQIGSYFGKKNGQSITLSAKPRIVDNVAMVPIRFVSEAFGATVSWNAEKRLVEIVSSFETAKEEKKEVGVERNIAENQLTYDDALKLVYKNSLELKKAKEDIEQKLDTKEQAGKNITFIPSGIGNGSSDASSRSALLRASQAEVSYQISKKQMEILEEKLAYQVRTAYNEIIKKKDQLELSELLIKNAESKLKIAQIKTNNGQESKYNLEIAEKAVSEEKQKKATQEKELDSLYIKLNKLIGKNESERYAVVNDNVLTWLKDTDLETTITRVITDNPSIWIQEQQLALTEQSLDLHTYNAGSLDSYNSKKIDVNKSKIELAQLKRTIEEQTRLRYLDMKTIESKYQELDISINKTESSLNLLRKQYDVGMVTLLDVQQAELALQQLEAQKLSMTITHEQTKLIFTKPWLL